MITFLAGPAFSMFPPESRGRSLQRSILTPVRARRLAVSSDGSSGDHAQPHGDESDDDAENDIESGDEEFAILKNAKGFIFERGKRAVAADEADGDQIAPIGAPVCFLREERDDQADQKARRAVHDEGAVRETSAHAVADEASHPELYFQNEASTETDHQVFDHVRE